MRFKQNWVFATKSNLLIPISLQFDGVKCKPLILQTWNMWSNTMLSLKCLRSTTLVCKYTKGVNKIIVCEKGSIYLFASAWRVRVSLYSVLSWERTFSLNSRNHPFVSISTILLKNQTIYTTTQKKQLKTIW